MTTKLNPWCPLPALAAALAFLGAISTAEADPQASPIIPGDPEKSADGELPAPYAAWQGRRHALPGAGRDRVVPAPLARPSELPRRPFELTLGGAAFLPSCSAGSLDDRGCVTLQPGGGLEAALLYRVGPFFAAGVDGALSGFSRSGRGPLSSAGGGGGFVGVSGRVYFADSGAWDPHVALSLGYGALHLNEAKNELSQNRPATRGGSNGFGARVSGGVDFLLGSHLRLGPALSFAHFIAWSEERCSGLVCRDERLSYGRLLGFATLGLRATASLGDAL